MSWPLAAVLVIGTVCFTLILITLIVVTGGSFSGNDVGGSEQVSGGRIDGEGDEPSER